MTAAIIAAIIGLALGIGVGSGTAAGAMARKARTACLERAKHERINSGVAQRVCGSRKGRDAVEANQSWDVAMRRARSRI